MPTKKILLVFCLFLTCRFCTANQSDTLYAILNLPAENADIFSELTASDQCYAATAHLRPTPLLRLFHDKEKKNKKITAAILAFPLPFGIVGLHRIYLGCAPYVPVVYIASFGGILGLLPMIDFFFIVLDKKIDPYMNNKKVFMWVN